MTTATRGGLFVPLSDLGNGIRLAQRERGRLVYNGDAGAWFVFDGGHWRPDIDGRVMAAAKRCALSIEDEAAAIDNDDVAEAVSKWGRRSQGLGKLEAMIKLATSEPGMMTRAADFDADPWSLNCRNGVVDLTSGSIAPHDPARRCAKISPVDFDPFATAPTWRAFVEWAFAGDSELIDFVQRCAGYSLTASTRDHVFLFLYGTGANGKSTFLNALLALLGDYGGQASPDLLVATRYPVHPTQVADLCGRRCVVGSEVAEGAGFDEVKLKWLTGGDRIKARYMRRDFFEFEPTHKLWLAGNHKPRVRGTDRGIWRRMRLVPFVRTLTAGEMDPDLPLKLRAELPGILTWAVNGAVRWFEQGLTMPAAVRDATDDYRREEDVLGLFLDECTEPAAYGEPPKKTLRLRYESWCSNHGHRPMSPHAVRARLLGRGITEARIGNVRIWRGLRIREG